jgi:hypothetical protein
MGRANAAVRKNRQKLMSSALASVGIQRGANPTPAPKNHGAEQEEIKTNALVEDLLLFQVRTINLWSGSLGFWTA